MPDLRNSSRVLYKATHVATVPPINGTNQPTREALPGRAFAKVGYLRALRINEKELPALRAALKDAPKQRSDKGESVDRALRVVARLAKDSSPMASFNHAADLAKIPQSALGVIGTALLDVRKAVGETLQQASDRIRADYLKSNAPSANPAREHKGVAVQPGVPSRDTSFAAALRWASDTDHPSFQILHKLAVDRTPSDAVLSGLDRASQAATILVRLHQQVGYTAAIAGTVNQFLPIEPVGQLHLERIEMRPVGIERGELVYSVPLTPKEVVNITHKEWSQETQGFEDIVDDELQGYSEKGVAEKNDVSMATDDESKHATAMNVGVSLSASYASVTLSSNFGFNTSSDNSQSKKDSRDHSNSITSKASARTRKDHKTSFNVSSVAGAEDMAVRVIKNQTDSAMRVDYYQMMRKWKVDLIRYGLRMTYDIVIPSPGAELMEKLDLIQALEDQINTPFAFALDFTTITAGNYASLAATYGAGVQPPPQALEQQILTQLLTKNDSDDFTWANIDFEIDDDYELDEADFLEMGEVQVDGNGVPNDDKLWFGVEGDLTPPQTRANSAQFESSLPQLLGRSGKMSIVYGYRHVKGGAITLTLTAKPKDTIMQAWALGAWTAMRDSAQTQYQASLQTLQNERTQLLNEVGEFDGLTLRQMEREEIMKGVLRWLFGPAFSLVPDDISSLFTAVPDDPMATWLDPSTMDFPGNQSWQNVMSFGEFIKYIHNAIEWENVLYLNYPYFWDAPANWKLKKFLNHPDALHRMFLRSGAARVVLTIRPGYEPGFTAMMDSGAFQQVPQGPNPYTTIAQEIQDFADTNYPGIAPANPDTNARPLIYLEQRRVWAEMQYIIHLLQAYIADPANDSEYPSTADGLVALQPYVAQLTADNKAWNIAHADEIAADPILKKPTPASVPLKDFWGNAYVYACPGTTGDYDLISLGLDGKAGGDDKNQDISANANGSIIATWFEYTPTSALDLSVNTNLPPTGPDDMA